MNRARSRLANADALRASTPAEGLAKLEKQLKCDANRIARASMTPEELCADLEAQKLAIRQARNARTAAKVDAGIQLAAQRALAAARPPPRRIESVLRVKHVLRLELKDTAGVVLGTPIRNEDLRFIEAFADVRKDGARTLQFRVTFEDGRSLVWSQRSPLADLWQFALGRDAVPVYGGVDVLDFTSASSTALQLEAVLKAWDTGELSSVVRAPGADASDSTSVCSEASPASSASTMRGLGPFAGKPLPHRTAHRMAEGTVTAVNADGTYGVVWHTLRDPVPDGTSVRSKASPASSAAALEQVADAYPSVDEDPVVCGLDLSCASAAALQVDVCVCVLGRERGGQPETQGPVDMDPC